MMMSEKHGRIFSPTSKPPAGILSCCSLLLGAYLSLYVGLKRGYSRHVTLICYLSLRSEKINNNATTLNHPKEPDRNNSWKTTESIIVTLTYQ
jgi:hypothetical protein